MSDEINIDGIIRLWIIFQTIANIMSSGAPRHLPNMSKFPALWPTAEQQRKVEIRNQMSCSKDTCWCCRSWNWPKILDLAYKCPFQMSFKTVFPVWDIFAVCWAWQISSYMLQNEGRRALIRRSSNPFDHHQAILLTRPGLHQQLASSSTSFSSSSSSSLFWSSVNSAVHPSRHLSAVIKLVMLDCLFWRANEILVDSEVEGDWGNFLALDHIFQILPGFVSYHLVTNLGKHLMKKRVVCLGKQLLTPHPPPSYRRFGVIYCYKPFWQFLESKEIKWPEEKLS